MEILVVTDPVMDPVLRKLADAWHGVLIKGVADVAQGRIVLGGEWHMDANALLLSAGSRQEDVWGFNLYPDEAGSDAIEYISLINIRPAQGNRSMAIEDAALQERIRNAVRPWVPTLGL